MVADAPPAVACPGHTERHEMGGWPVEFQQVVGKRRMVRAFREDPLDPAVVERILANGNRAPSAGFTQGYAFLVLEAAEERARFWQTVAAAGHPPDPGEMAAPLLVVPLACRPPTWIATPSRTRAGPTATRAAGRSRTGTSTPASPRC